MRGNHDVAVRRYGGKNGVVVTLGLFDSGSISVKGNRSGVGPAERLRCEAWVRQTLDTYDHPVPPPVRLSRLLWGHF